MFSFLNPWMLLGMLLIAIPILIHIFNRSRYRIERWGAMMFLRQAMQVRSQRIRVEQILLLVLRCLFLGLLALGLARPIANWGTGAWDDPTTHLLVFDDSYSMHQGQGEENAFEKARNAALHIVDEMNDKDNMLILRAGNSPRSMFNRPSFDKPFLRRTIEEMKPGRDQAMDLPKTLDQAYYMLSRSTLPRHRIYLLTDGQRHGWRPEDESRWTKVSENLEKQKVAPHLYVLNQAPDDEIENVAIARVYPRSPVVDIFRPSTFLVELHNTLSEKRTVKLTFKVDGIVQKEKDFDCPPGVHLVDFDHHFTAQDPLRKALEQGGDEEGGPTRSHYVEVSIDEDDLLPDNDFTLALEVRHTIPVLIVDGNSAEDLWASSGGMMALALRSAGVFGREGLFTVAHKSLTALEDLDARGLEAYRAVVLANMPSLSRNLEFALEQFVKEGGGLLVALGEDVEPDLYNKWHDEGEGLFPARLTETVEYEKGEEPYHPRFPAGAASHILDIFDTTRTRVLKEVRATKYWRCKPPEDARSIAFFDKDPFIVYRPFGEGMVVLWTSTLNSKWTNFPMTQDYLPLVQNFMIYLSAVVQPPINLAQLDTLVYSVPMELLADRWETNELKVCTVTTPDGGTNDVEGEVLGSEWVAEWQNTATSGLYTVSAEGLDPKYYAVAFQPGEEDLKELDEETRAPFNEQIVHKFLKTTAELDLAVQEETGVSEWWRWFVLIASALLCVELFLGWRFSA